MKADWSVYTKNELINEIEKLRVENQRLKKELKTEREKGKQDVLDFLES